MAKFCVALILAAALFATSVAAEEPADQDACPQVCPALYAPLCATDGKIYKEFSNDCELEASNCRLERSALKTYVTTLMDWCSTELVENLDNLLVKLNNLDITKRECMKPCPMIYKPVCISNGKYRVSASNDCLMDNINCALASENLQSHIFKVIQNTTC